MESLADFLGVQRVGLPDTPKAPPPNPKLTGKDFARALIFSEEYRQTLYDRARLGILHPTVEKFLLEHAFGRPIEQIEVKDTTNRFEDWSVEDLETRAMQLWEQARKLRESDIVDGESVH